MIRKPSVIIFLEPVKIAQKGREGNIISIYVFFILPTDYHFTLILINAK